MAIEIKSKTGIKKKLLLGGFLAFSLILFVAILATYFYFININKELAQDISDKEQALENTNSEAELEKELLLYESKIGIYQRLFSSHEKPLNIFTLLEKVSHPNIWFSEFNFSSELDSIIISGEAKNFTDIGQQLIFLKEESNFKKVILSEISMNDEEIVNFSLQLIPDPQVLK